MGNIKSTCGAAKATSPVEQDNDNENSRESAAPYEKELLHIRDSLENDPEAFLLNNLILSVQMFENYEREIAEIRSRLVSQKENDLNKILSQSQKHLLLPDVLQEQMSNHVMFKSRKPIDFESVIEPIQPVRMYVVLDNVNVNDVNEKREYYESSENEIFYDMSLEPSRNNGFVRIRSTNTMQAPKRNYTQSMTSLHDLGKTIEESEILGMDKGYSRTNLSNLNNPDDEGYQESYCSGISDHRLGGSIKNNRHSKHRRSVESIPRSSRSSGYKSGSSRTNYVIDNDNDYATIASSRTSLTSTFSAANLPNCSSEIPVSCFKNFLCTRDGELYSEKLKRVKLDNSRHRRIRRAEQCQTESRSYLRKDKFRRYFEKLFVNRLAQPLGFDIEDVIDVTRQGAVIHCSSIKTQEKSPALIISYEIVPSLRSKWPKCCNEWLERAKYSVDRNDGSWLTTEIIEEVERLGCHIIPEGFPTTAKNSDPYHVVEWQITLPAVERCLETTFSHSQARIYLTTLMLHKFFINSEINTRGLTTSHIRSQLFWLLEQNSSTLTWSEYRGGEGVRGLLRKLYHTVAQRQPCLRDYLISKKNLLKNVSTHDLHVSHKQIKRIIENPVMYLIASMKNIEYKPDFFPRLDYRRLYKLLILDYKKLVAFINPALSSDDKFVQQANEREIKKLDERFNRIGNMMENARNCNNQTKIAYNELVVEITDECAELHGLRLSSILDMFIEHFMKMAECCYRYEATNEKDVYLNQAHCLSVILSEQYYGKEDAISYLKTIANLRQKLSGNQLEQENSIQSLERINDIRSISIPMNEYFADEQEITGEFDGEYSRENSVTINDIESETSL